MLVSCAGSDIPDMQDEPDRSLTVASVPKRNELVRGEDEPAVVTLDIKTALKPRKLSTGEPLPSNIQVPQTNLDGVPVAAALQAVLSGTDISLSWDSGELGSRLVTVMNLKGPLSSVVEKICFAAGLFCTHRHGTITLSETATFVVSIPPVPKSIGTTSISSASFNTSGISNNNSFTNTMVEAITKLVGSEGTSIVDEQAGTIIYTTTVKAEEKISRYLEELRTERPLVVLQMYIWEVQLNKDNAQGIKWSEFKVDLGRDLGLNLTNALSNLATGTGAVSLGAVTSGKISADMVASFIATKGRVKSISNPQITFVSGSSAALVVGGTKKYISQVGNSTTNTGGTYSSNTVTTDEIQTGLAINVAGSYEGGIVFANLDLSLRSLVGLFSLTINGNQTIDLPETVDERINTVLRVRPGDSLLLAGFVSSYNNTGRQGFPLVADASVPLYGREERQNRELVMIVRPSIVLFGHKGAEGLHDAARAETALPKAVMIDNKGARPLQNAEPVIRGTPVTNIPISSGVENSIKPRVQPDVRPNLRPSVQVYEIPAAVSPAVSGSTDTNKFSGAFNSLIADENKTSDGGQ